MFDTHVQNALETDAKAESDNELEQQNKVFFLCHYVPMDHDLLYCA